MEAPVDDHCITKEDLGPPTPKLPADLRCSQITSIDKELEIYQIRREYVTSMIDLEKRTPSATTETKSKLEEEFKTLKENLSVLEGKLADYLPCPNALCYHNSKNKAVKRTAEPVIRLAKFTAKAANNSKTNINNTKNNNAEFVFPKKTTKNIPIKEMEKLATTNAFAALNTAEDDAEDVSPPQYKIKPIFMKIFNAYNLILQELHRSYPTATNTLTKGYIKIEAQSADDHINITNYLKEKELEHYVIEPPCTRPLKLVIKGLPDNIDPVDIKNDLVAKGINIVKIAQLRKFITKTPLPIYMIEIERDEHVNDIFQVRSCLYMQIKLDPFRKGNRITQCYNCNFFHHASQNCNMKTRCLKCGANHRTGACEIKERIENPLCINCNTRGHMASSTECPQFPKPKKGKSKSPVENLKRNINNNPVKTGITYAQILNSEKAQQMAAPGNASSASNKTENIKMKILIWKHLMLPNLTQTSLAFYKPYSKCKRYLASFPHYSVR
ncbi:uncharacterized protein TNCV_3694591 [Trichonephila clavipes]|nr:uncharacterized protein TNCV_3694591 [Trichonephila clavipes]